MSGANVVPLGVRRQVGSSQEQNVVEKSSWNDSLPVQDETVQPSGWDDVPATRTRTPTQRDGNWGEGDADDPNALPRSSDPDPAADSGVDWSQLVSGSTQVDAWESFAVSQGTEAAGDGWDALPATYVAGNGTGARQSDREHTDHRHRFGAEDSPSQERHFRGRDENRESDRPWTSGRGGRGRGRGGRGNDWGPTRSTFRRQDIEPECKEIDDLVKSMGRILYNQKSDIGGRLSDKDDEAVQAVLAYHPNLTEKTGCGVAYIKVDKSQNYPDVHCFWLVRTDGSEDEFSYHKCLKEKVQREFPSFIDRYDALYTVRGRGTPAAPAANAVEGQASQQDVDKQADQESAPAADFTEGDAGQTDTDTQPDQESTQMTAVDTQADQESTQMTVVDTPADQESTRMTVVDTQASQSN